MRFKFGLSVAQMGANFTWPGLQARHQRFPAQRMSMHLTEFVSDFQLSWGTFVGPGWARCKAQWEESSLSGLHTDMHYSLAWK